MSPRPAWPVAAVAFVAMFVSVGTGFSYGALVLPATRDLGEPQGVVAGVFAVTVMTFFLAGAPTGALSDRFGARGVLVGGAFALGGGLALTATSGSVLGLYLGHGVLVGLGMASTFVPLTVAVSSAFVRRRALALGIAVSGIGVGTLVMAPAIALMIRVLGWREAYLVLALGCGAVLLAGAVLVGRRHGHAHHGAGPPLRRVVATAQFRWLYAAQVLLSVAIFVPFSHLPAFAEEAGSDPVAAAGLVGAVGAASVLGRLTLGPVAERLGVLRTYRLCFLAVGVSFVLWLWPLWVWPVWSWPPTVYPLLLLHALLLGVGYGGFVALLPVVLVERFGLAGLGGVLGTMYTANVLGAGAGPLAMGLLIEGFGYVPAGLAGLVCGLAAATLLGRVDGARIAEPEVGQGVPRRR
ncbi:MAG: MFS transporter [Actinomycetes bacterium]